MTAFVLLLICVAAQVLIAAGLGIYFLKGYLKKRQGKEAPPPESKVPPAPH
jgi:hypothetical protein